MSNIPYKDISVVVQGPIYGSSKDQENMQMTKLCCKSIRANFPGAEIILSTWKGSEVSHIDYDVLVENEDPGSVQMTLNRVKRPNNSNRMILSTNNGISKATRKYCMRMRSDMIIRGDDILKYFAKYNIKSKGQIVEERILTLSAIHPIRGRAVFSVNDWFYFGLTKDLYNLYNIPLQDNKALKLEANEEYPSWENNIVAEQYVWMTFLKKYSYYNEKINISRMHEVNHDAITVYEESIASNLVLLPAWKIKLNSLKLPNKNYVARSFLRMSCYSQSEWEYLYKKYVDKYYKTSWRLKDSIDLVLYRLMFFTKGNFSWIYMVGKKLYNSR